MPYNSPLIEIPLPSASDPANVPSDLQNAFYKMEKYGIITCTSTTRPSSPHSGMTIYETDTRKVYMYVGTAWLHHNPVVNCTSSTRPSTPFEGMMIYETNTGSHYVYYGATTGWRPPWNTPWGVMHQVTFTSQQTFSTTGAVLMTGSTLPSFTFLAGRRYLLRAFIPSVQVSGTSFVAGLNITDASGNQWARHEVSVRSATESWAFTPVFMVAPSGTFPAQYELRGFCSAGSSSWKTNVGTFIPGVFTLEDVGAA